MDAERRAAVAEYRAELAKTERDAAQARVRDRDGRITHIEERSPLVRALADASYRLRRWYYHPMLKPRVRGIIEDVTA